jgi:hypothetical protein
MCCAAAYDGSDAVTRRSCASHVKLHFPPLPTPHRRRLPPTPFDAAHASYRAHVSEAQSFAAAALLPFKTSPSLLLTVPLLGQRTVFGLT